MYKVVLMFYDEKLHHPGEIVNWTDQKRIDNAIERGLIEEIKTEAVKEEPKATAKRKK